MIRGRDTDPGLYRRVSRLPDQLTRARRRVVQLETEARRFGFHDLLPDHPR
jgi:hypothetical protein